MSAERPSAENRDVRQPETPSLSDRAMMRASLAAGCFALVAGTAYMAYFWSINGQDVSWPQSALAASIFFAFPAAIAAELATAIVMKRWSAQLWVAAIALSVWLLIEMLVLNAVLTRSGWRLA